MEIINYRHRFANNSSSSHSVCFAKGTINHDSHLMYPLSECTGMKDMSGWGYFVASTPWDKACYLAQAIYTSIDSFLGTESLGAGRALAEKITGVPADEVQSIDHQSAFIIPMGYPDAGWDGPIYTVPKDMLNSLQTVIINNSDVTIYGGNDNDESYERIPDTAINTSFYNMFPQGGKYISRREYARDRHINTHIYSLYDIETGNRVTVNLTPWEKSSSSKLHAPLLVDMKITDHCKYGCEFCYQGSTPEGKHADFGFVSQLIKDLHSMQVFEIAFGGGEPTSHPKFDLILRECWQCGIQPNFTTFNLNFLKNKDIKHAVKAYKCSVAVSNPTEAAVSKIAMLREEGYRISAQFVDGLRDITGIVQKCVGMCVPVTILGYKMSGRGGDYLRSGNSKYFMSHDDFINNVGLSNNLAYDTVFLRQHTEALPLLDWRSYDTREGYQSWYIDAVAQKHGPSSYETDTLLPLHYEYFSGYYPKYRNTKGLEADWDSCPVTE